MLHPDYCDAIERMDRFRQMAYNTGMLPPLFPPGFLLTIYLVSAVLYLVHVYLARHFWPATEDGKKHPHFLVRITLLWKLSSNGYFPLTNGSVALHTLFGLIPAVNTILLWYSFWMHLMFVVWNYVENMLGKGWFCRTAIPKSNTKASRM